MHVAVLDDNLVDRNQMNRLLTRVSDENKKNGKEGLFIDLYGNYSALLHNVAIYDAIFIDVVNEEIKGHELAHGIHYQGVNAKVVLMNSEIIYNEILDDSEKEKYLYINKPIKVPELKDILLVCEEARKHREPKLELRSDVETLYVKGDEFVYARISEPGKITVKLSFDKEITFLSDMSSFKRDAEIFNQIVMVNNSTLINRNYIKEVSLFAVTMQDGISFKTTPFISRKLKS